MMLRLKVFPLVTLMALLSLMACTQFGKVNSNAISLQAIDSGFISAVLNADFVNAYVMGELR